MISCSGSSPEPTTQPFHREHLGATDELRPHSQMGVIGNLALIPPARRSGGGTVPSPAPDGTVSFFIGVGRNQPIRILIGVT